MVKIDYKVCNRCEGAREKRCQRICPGDLIGVNPEDDRPVVLYPEDCWACTACVKDCPVAAITLKLPFQALEKGILFGPLQKAGRPPGYWKGRTARRRSLR